MSVAISILVFGFLVSGLLMSTLIMSTHASAQEARSLEELYETQRYPRDLNVHEPYEGHDDGEVCAGEGCPALPLPWYRKLVKKRGVVEQPKQEEGIDLPDFDWNVPDWAGYVLLGLLAMMLLFVAFSIYRGRIREDDEFAVGENEHELDANEGALFGPDELAASGHFADAVALLVELTMHELGWRPERERDRTVREFRRQVRRDFGESHPFLSMATLAEQVRFAGMVASADEYERARSLYWTIKGGHE